MREAERPLGGTVGDSLPPPRPVDRDQLPSAYARYEARAAALRGGTWGDALLRLFDDVFPDAPPGLVTIERDTMQPNGVTALWRGSGGATRAWLTVSAGRPYADGAVWLRLDEIRLAPEVQGRGLARDVVLRLAALGATKRAAGLTTWAVTGDSLSRFGHLGFLPSPERCGDDTTWDALRATLRASVEQPDVTQRGEGPVPRLTAAVRDALDDPDPKAYWRLSDDPDGQQLLTQAHVRQDARTPAMLTLPFAESACLDRLVRPTPRTRHAAALGIATPAVPRRP